MLRILVLQTCDGVNYAPLLNYTQPKHEAYCRKQGYDYMRWDGIKKGQDGFPAFAAFNKIYLLQEILASEKYDWVVYLEAASIIIDTEHPIEDFLHLNKVLVAGKISVDEPTNCDVSFSLYNMNHPKLKILLDEWQNIYEANLMKDKLNQFKNGWANFKSYNDQQLLNEIIKKKQTYAFLYDATFFMDDIKFLAYVKRERNMSVSKRLEILQDFYNSRKNTLDSHHLVPQVQQQKQEQQEPVPSGQP
jgi:hypothetical protein